MRHLLHQRGVGRRSGQDGDAVGKKSVLFLRLDDGQVAVDGIAIAYHVVRGPLLAHEPVVNAARVDREEQEHVRQQEHNDGSQTDQSLY